MKVRTYVEALQDLGYDAVGVGDMELASGLDLYDDLIGKAGLPVTSATFTERGGDAPLVPPYLIKEYELPGKRTFRVGYISLVPYNSAVARLGSNGRAVVSRDPADQARRYVPEVAAKVDFVVLLANLGTRDLQRVGEAVPGGIHLALATISDRISPGALENFGGIPTFFAGDQGKRLGEVRVFLDGVKVRQMKGVHVYLTKRYPEEPRYQKKIDQTLLKVNEIYKAIPRPSGQAMPGSVEITSGSIPGGRKYLTPDACSDCHDQAYRVWEGSAHAHAMDTLRKANQDFNPECVRCHTTAFGMPGGFRTATATPTLINVQCEACHGSASIHVLDATVPYGRVAPRVCYTCHTKENSPEFSFFKYWDAIKH